MAGTDGRLRFFFVGMTSLPALSRNVTKLLLIDRCSKGAPSSPWFSSNSTTSQPRCFFSSNVATLPDALIRNFCCCSWPLNNPGGDDVNRKGGAWPFSGRGGDAIIG